MICSDAVGAGLDLVEENVNGLRFASGNVDELERCMALWCRIGMLHGRGAIYPGKKHKACH